MNTTKKEQLTITGKILEIGSPTNGKDWQKQEFTLLVGDLYPKQVRLSVWNSNMLWLERSRVGDIVDCQINISSKQHEDKWYTEITAWTIRVDIKKTSESQQKIKSEAENNKNVPELIKETVKEIANHFDNFKMPTGENDFETT